MTLTGWGILAGWGTIMREEGLFDWKRLAGWEGDQGGGTLSWESNMGQLLVISVTFITFLCCYHTLLVPVSMATQ